MDGNEKEKILQVVQYLGSLNIKHALRGYTYLVACISILIDEPTRIKRITGVYEEVGRKFSADANNIQHVIKTAIFETGMTNKEFLAKAANHIRNWNHENNVIVKESINQPNEIIL